MCVCLFVSAHQSRSPDVTGVGERPAGGIKHHHLPAADRDPQLTWSNTHTLLNTSHKQTCDLLVRVFTHVRLQDKCGNKQQIKELADELYVEKPFLRRLTPLGLPQT